MTDVPAEPPREMPAGFPPPIPPGEDVPGSTEPGDDEDELDREDVYPDMPDGGAV